LSLVLGDIGLINAIVGISFEIVEKAGGGHKKKEAASIDKEAKKEK
jgi:hypothetical protein